MKKLIATVLSFLLFLTICLPSLQSSFPDSGGYIDRDFLCRWIAAVKGDRLVLDTAAQDESICSGTISASPHYQYRKNCVRKCEPLAIADQILKSAQETTVAIEDRVRSILALRL